MNAQAKMNAPLTLVGLFDIADAGTTIASGLFAGEIREKWTCHGDLVLDFTARDMAETASFHMPPDFTVDGNLKIKAWPFETLPDRLTVTGNLEVMDAGLRILPPGLDVGRILDLTGNRYPLKLPADLKVGSCIET